MTDRPILFSAPMVRALLDGTKTQTRRILKPRKQPSLIDGDWSDSYVLDAGNAEWLARDVLYKKGDRLWVKETHAYVGSCDPGYLLFRASDFTEQCDRYGFDQPYPPISDVKWTPSIFMRRKSSRLTLTVTDVRVQRLQDCSNEDAIAEGIERDTEHPNLWKRGKLEGDQNLVDVTGFPILAYRSIWENINGPASWKANPWVVAISFDVDKRNIDQ